MVAVQEPRCLQHHCVLFLLFFFLPQALQHYAGAIEMMALCGFMLQAREGETETLLSHASNWYSRSVFGTTQGSTGTLDASGVWAGKPREEGVGFRLATRLAYILTDILLAAGNHKQQQAAQLLLLTARQEEPLNAALLTESAALCYLRCGRGVVVAVSPTLRVLSDHRWRCIVTGRNQRVSASIRTIS